jgi:hypothetical protein
LGSWLFGVLVGMNLVFDWLIVGMVDYLVVD